MSRRNRQPSDLAEEYAFLNELAKEKRNESEPQRWEYVLTALKEKGYKPVEDKENKCIRFEFRGNIITIWPYKKWFSGKGVKDGRGIDKLLKQI